MKLVAKDERTFRTSAFQVFLAVEMLHINLSSMTRPHAHRCGAAQLGVLQ